MKDPLPPRGQWMRCLLQQPPAEVQAVAAAIAQAYPVEHQQLPEAGLSLLQLREPNRGECFYLGEIPHARSAVTLRTPSGASVNGGAVLMHDDPQFAWAAAVIDAAVAAELPESLPARKLLEDGQAAAQREDCIRQELLLRTTVDFQLLEDDDDNE